MALDTAPVTGRVALPDDTPMINGSLVFTLSGPDTQDDQAVPPSKVKVALTDDGSLPDDFALWRNTAGARGTTYDVKAVGYFEQRDGVSIFKQLDLGTVQVGAASSYTIAELLNNPASPAPGIYLTTAYVASIAAMKALPKGGLTDGKVCHVASYIAGGFGGGGTFRWSAASTATTNIATVFAANEGGAGRWIRLHGGTLTPMDAGAVSNDGGDHTAAFTALINLHNTDDNVRSINPAGVWNCNGGLPNVTRTKLDIRAVGYCMITRTSSGTLFTLNGDTPTFWGVGIDGGDKDGPNAKTGKLVVVNGANPRILWNDLTGGSDNTITTQSGATGATILGNRATNMGGAALGLGNSSYAMVLLNDFSFSGPELIQMNGGNKSFVGINRLHDGNGVGNLAGSNVDYVTAVLNMTYNGNSGIKYGQKGIEGSHYNIAALNMMFDNKKNGLNWQNYRREAVPIDITRASPAVVTFARKAITGLAPDRPIRLTVVGHGFRDGDIIQVNDIVGTVELNGEYYRVHVYDADHVDLLDLDNGTPIAFAGKTAYVSGGYLDHPFEGDRGWANFSGLGGMVELNGGAAHIRSRTASTITLENGDGSDFSTIGMSAFTSGGLVFVGEQSHNGIVGLNMAVNNPDGGYVVGDRAVLPDYPRHVIMGNVDVGGGEHYFSAEGSVVMNQQVYLRAALTADVLHASGAGENYVPLFTAVSDVAGIYDPTNGKATMPRAGLLIAHAKASFKNAQNSTGCYINIRVAYPDGSERDLITSTAFPEVDAVSSSIRSGSAFIMVPVLEGTRVFCRYSATGLSAGDVGLSTGGGSGQEKCSIALILI